MVRNNVPEAVSWSINSWPRDQMKRSPRGLSRTVSFTPGTLSSRRIPEARSIKITRPANAPRAKKVRSSAVRVGRQPRRSLPLAPKTWAARPVSRSHRTISPEVYWIVT
jgi:hypothetical protein